ncbi:TIGR03085 family metal-binding protein [Nakamurella leprariae]|uniref:TIGR03085 family protein n=1 Tax=Nakamurella leprariae TaxID=2803911 RepID=A0A938YEK4_9ACTN|nr:TIGR03085 family metal-binding protein [Nakamurella leprariae]MBM9466754.1 TIGR03085 family protein [Nakamurella leprariae]
MTLAQRERADLADLFDEVGPDHPTLDEGWQAQDLLVHLLIRERRPDAVPGALATLPVLSGWSRRVGAGYAGRPWSQQVQLVRSGPPRWSVFGISARIDALANGGEYFIHHEDLRRGAPGWQPRRLDATRTAELVRMLRSPIARRLVRRVPGGVVAELVTGSGSTETVRLKDGTPAATIAGEPGEVLLWLSGRDACHVELSGDPGVMDALRAMERGM